MTAPEAKDVPTGRGYRRLVQQAHADGDMTRFPRPASAGQPSWILLLAQRLLKHNMMYKKVNRPSSMACQALVMHFLSLRTV